MCFRRKQTIQTDWKRNSKEYLKELQKFLDIADGNNPKYIINEKRVKKIDKLCKILKMAKGLKAGDSIYNSLSGYQWLLIVASLCTVYRDNKKKRRYETVVLEICRKNGKTFIVDLDKKVMKKFVLLSSQYLHFY